MLRRLVPWFAVGAFIGYLILADWLAHWLVVSPDMMWSLVSITR